MATADDGSGPDRDLKTLRLTRPSPATLQRPPEEPEWGVPGPPEEQEPPAPSAPGPTPGPAGPGRRGWPLRLLLGRPEDTRRWRRGWILAVLAVLSALPMLLRDFVSNSFGNVASLLDTGLPWVGTAVPVLLLGALLRRARVALLALLLPIVVWIGMFGSVLLPKGTPGAGDLRVLAHNVGAANPDPTGTARALLAAEADVIALEEITDEALPVYQEVLAAEYPYSVRGGTVGLWSRYPVGESADIDISIGWTRALRAEVETPSGPLAVYVAHLASVRVGAEGFSSDQRNETIEALGATISEEPLERVVLMGDLNGTATDRSLSPITAGMRSAQGAAGDGFGFTWPASFPMARIDHVLVKGVEPVDSWVLPATGSDHRPIAADLDL
ncbi:endonuclease/exonuclease/phosphatase family protein [Allostreptomyces psammosilenae]|uniref:Vancomycin resistance protein VanJ n=1 Tax=Allostreptomyces psammosilenae TaxID=1892865 RepID=A0A852ZXY9_9ACTN|nr:endonuclease/exonuclease/phosphatase family protein [Allostreptomyces psammosilenae]NYI06915.1 vancomycin resistance protein VanJ [Allostreptomyces psammosilenae]